MDGSKASMIDLFHELSDHVWEVAEFRAFFESELAARVPASEILKPSAKTVFCVFLGCLVETWEGIEDEKQECGFESDGSQGSRAA